jgi:CheY-like chemotaxis protein
VITVAGPTVLVVEDDSTDVLLIERAFRKAHVAAAMQVVGDGDKAIAYLGGDGPYTDRARYPLPVLVLLDLKLPRRSGLEVLRWLRGQPGVRRLPVVVLTSSRQRSDVNRAYEHGANSYLVKPVDFDPLLDMIRALNLYWLVHNERADADAE